MNNPTTFKGRLMRLAASVAVVGPWRDTIERLACKVGHRYPASRLIVSFCRHLGGRLIQREGERFERVAIFASGGKMRCGGEGRDAPLGALHYFLGTITNQDEDERAVVALLSLAIRHGDVFFDIGANYGFYSFFVGPLCGTSGVVHAFEANPLLIAHLRGSSELNESHSRIVVNAVAVGSESGKVLRLYDPERIGGSSLYPLDWLNAESSVLVPVTTIDEYRRANSIKRIDVMKIDIEGAELDAFRGMEETFQVCPPALIICELILVSVERSDVDPIKIVDFLEAKGYEARYIRDADGRIGGLVRREDLKRLAQNLINVAFVLSDLKGIRPELFAN